MLANVQGRIQVTRERVLRAVAIADLEVKVGLDLMARCVSALTGFPNQGPLRNPFAFLNLQRRQMGITGQMAVRVQNV